MEAYILEERVLTAEHMTRNRHNDLKYLKKYDLPPQTPPTHKNEQRSRENRPPRTPPINFRKIKNLLSTLSEGVGGRTGQQQREDKIDRYFVSLSDSSNTLPDKKTKGALLIRKIMPQSQQYDANLTSVCPRSPCWTFNPHDRPTGHPKPDNTPPQPRINRSSRVQTSEKRGRRRGSRVTESEEYVLQRVQRKIYEQMRERSGFGQYQHQCKLQYSPLDLGRCASEIFKKYQLDSNAYFKKLVSEMQHL